MRVALGSSSRDDQHRDEDEIVDAEHDLHHRQGDEGGPGVRIEDQSSIVYPGGMRAIQQPEREEVKRRSHKAQP